MHIHAFCPAEGTREAAVPNVLARVADTDAVVQGVPVGIGLTVVGGVVPYLAVGEGGVVHLIDYGQTQLDVGGNIGYLVVCHAVAFELQ